MMDGEAAGKKGRVRRGICALLTLPVAMVPRVMNPCVVVFLAGIAAAAHQVFSANIFTIAGLACLVAVSTIHLLAPWREPAPFPADR